ncbi:MAG: family 43 glycosylhydrolase [Lachnospiraceae bacterium]|nr:family 43 glycosylhydrolase [Lachnospiraceae bacterium]MBD5494497.1 family 43 glycosylhydrolase [Lachnospiraceae bacterium]
MDEKRRNGKITEYNTPFIEQRADPYVYRHTDGTYYFTASVPAYDCIALRKAETLEQLQTAQETIVWTKHESGEMSKHIWAPELHYLFGKWYIYFAAGEKDDIWKIRPFVLECTGEDPMTDSWVEKGKMERSDDDIYSFEAFSLDATVFENKGNYYYVWAEKVSVGIQISNLYIARMESATKLATAQVLLTTPDYDWERVDIWVNEGPAVIKRDGRIFLTYSASATGECYCMGMLSIDENDDLLDPRAWKKERKPVLCSDREKGFYGPGHNSFTKLPDGRDICVYHARTYLEIEGDPLYDPNRHTMLMEVKWNEQGYPIFDYANKVF